MDISSEASSDCNGNDVPDECEYRVDIDGDGFTTLNDHSVLDHHMTGPAEGDSLPALADGFRKPSGQLVALLQSHCLELLDPDHDGDTDLNDYAYLQRVLVAE